MEKQLSLETLTSLGLNTPSAKLIFQHLQQEQALKFPEKTWQTISSILSPTDAFEAHLYLYQWVYQSYDARTNPGPAWLPPTKPNAHITDALNELRFKDYKALHQWSITQREDYWAYTVKKLGIFFQQPYQKILNTTKGIEQPSWFDGAKLNIVDSCFQAPLDKIAIVYQGEQGKLNTVTYRTLKKLVAKVTHSLIEAGFNVGDAIAIDMPMNVEAIAIYLGIVAAGCHVVAIADSFAPPEIETRLRISNAKAIFTQNIFLRNGKIIPLYEKVMAAKAPMAIVHTEMPDEKINLRSHDIRFSDFLVDNDTYQSIACVPHHISNVLFSSGTTGDPKAIPWDHVTPIKSAADGYFHQDIHPDDIVAWPTNLGWMMGPWLIYACFINQATIALYYGIPTSRAFCEFVEKAKVTILGVVPSIVKSWKETNAIHGLNWSRLKTFSSTGESSNAIDMLYLMSQANYRPVIEYCGGTEIGGAYITSTLVEPNIPATFSTPTLGLDLVLLDDNRHPSKKGEVALIPPSIGLSHTLLNKDHHRVYYNGMPQGPHGTQLRRHGDEIEQLANGYYRALGRCDDTMNIGGIKVSSAEIEDALLDIEEILETAAIAVTPLIGGPSSIVIFVVPKPNQELQVDKVQSQIQKAISQKINPLFKVKDICILDALPRTSSNKVMRRVLRDQYQL